MELKEVKKILDLLETKQKYKDYEITNLMILKNNTINIFLRNGNKGLKINSDDLQKA